MKTSSAKNKGRLLQKWGVGRMYHHAPYLFPGDLRSTSMGAGGEDIQISPTARKTYPISVECKSKKAYAFYKDYDQAVANCPEGTEPVLLAKANHRKPVVVVDADWFFKLLAERFYKNT